MNPTNGILTATQQRAIRAVPGFSSSSYQNLNIPATLSFFKGRYIDELQRYTDIALSTLCDCGAGYGWLSFAYILSGGKFCYVVEYDSRRLAAAKAIADILGVTDRCLFICAKLDALPLRARSADIFASIETIEHVGLNNITSSLDEIVRVASKIILLTTPNKAFPVDLHDTRLPFAHWLPKYLRHAYAQLFGAARLHYNDFASPIRLRRLRPSFQPVTSVQHFASVKDWLASYPHYSPYGSGTRKEKPPRALRFYLTVTSSLLGCNAYFANPNLACIWLRKVVSENS